MAGKSTACDRAALGERASLGGRADFRGGWLGGETFAASVTGLDPKTVHAGRIELENDLDDCPQDRVRRPGAGRVPVEKKIRRSKAT